MKPILSLLFFSFFVAVFSVCKPPKNPPEEVTLLNNFKKTVATKLPINIPNNIDFAVNKSNIHLSTLQIVSFDFASADIDVPKANTVHMQFTNLKWSLGFNFAMVTNGDTQMGKAMLNMGNSSLTYTAAVLPGDFKGMDCKLSIADITMTADNQALMPLWNNLRPQVISALTTQLPQLVLSLNKNVISTQILPLIMFIEPLHIPDITSSNLLGSITLSNMAIFNVKIQSATMQQGAADNVIDFAMKNLNSNTTANWSVTAPFIGTVTGTAMVGLTNVSGDVSIGYGIDAKNQFTYQLSSANMTIGNAVITIDKKDAALQDLVTKITPKVVADIEATLEKKLCTFVNGNKN